ncbi:hypothetical protein QG37_02258 [Candidozyma auris]|uniref:Uncharacterized protein n=1 Tax=Candidozyma auris TaxID=498019 RepID=A0A0L0P2Z5_CANAR|nr:hypothetical protein QG37_02258 [[Candida] auris]
MFSQFFSAKAVLRHNQYTKLELAIIDLRSMLTWNYFQLILNFPDRPRGHCSHIESYLQESNAREWAIGGGTTKFNFVCFIPMPENFSLNLT